MEYELSFNKSYDVRPFKKFTSWSINTDPCYAYLHGPATSIVDQKLVMAHVYGHCDFFKNNQWFAPTNRKMMDVMANHATRIRRYMDRFGIDVVEDFIDKCLSLENLIDRYSPYIKKTSEKERQDEARNQAPGLLNVNRDYMSEYINPPAFVKEQKAKIAAEQERAGRFPVQPQRDVLEFLMHFAPLQNWQQDVLSIIRDEAYYFAPQGMTKIMNEGWASYWHSKMMTQKIMRDSEVIDFADAHSGTMAMQPGGFNPYKVGIELFREIEERWDKGQFGKAWNECNDVKEKKNWDTKAGLGKKKIFEIRRNYNDVTFIDEFLTEDFCVRNKMFVYKFNQRTNRYEVDTRDFPLIKKQLLFQLTNFGQPIIQIQDANFENRGELLLTHMYEGIDMQPDYMQQTLKNLQAIWQRPVNLATVMDQQGKLVRFDGQDYKEIALEAKPVSEAESG